VTADWERAVVAGDPLAVERLLDAGCPVDARDSHGQTALMNAARLGHIDVVRLLVARGANLDVTAKFRLSALMLAIVNGHEEVAGLLVDAGADLAIRGGKGAYGFYDKTAFDLAAARGMTRIAEEIRRHGEARGEIGTT
jgi:ankyrin repeat protein